MASEAKSRWKNAKQTIMAEQAVVEAIREEREKKRKSRRLKKACIKVLKFLFSTAGLFLINAALILGGAYMFSHLEKTNEQQGCRNSRDDYKEAENATLILLMDMAQRMDGIGAMTDVELLEVVAEFRGYLESFALSVIDTGYDVSLDCETMGEEGGTEFNWSVKGSLVFAITVATTIGYGHIAPLTKWGRLVCIAYAVVTIPIFLMFLANIGSILANLFQITYSTVCCCGCCRKKVEKEKSSEEEEKEEEYIQKVAQNWTLDPVSGRPIPPSECVEIEEEEEDEEEEEEEEEEELTVPLTVSVLVLAAFIIFGAIMFMEFEDWTFINSLYYCSITATTIGFGDVVPDLTLTGTKGVFKASAVIMYITFSMAGISMCFQLIADEIVAKFKWIGEKIGFKKKEEEPESEDAEEGNSKE
ncbi:TWiK family of potassium channels protein 9-like [Watersipora subatra]|uniref:TWiK family of potassium channels protein 9-like n=1 Tax=Watersipora subatra TaxID=2589382 RepID=UPI00355B468A